MAKTKSDVVAEAHRRLSVLSVDETPSADQDTYGGIQLDALFAELNAPPHSMGFTWTVETVPDAAFRPLAWLLASEMAAHYTVSGERRSRAMARLRGYAFPDDRDDRRDTNDDGTVSEAESNAGLRAAFY